MMVSLSLSSESSKFGGLLLDHARGGAQIGLRLNLELSGENIKLLKELALSPPGGQKVSLCLVNLVHQTLESSSVISTSVPLAKSPQTPFTSLPYRQLSCGISRALARSPPKES